MARLILEIAYYAGFEYFRVKTPGTDSRRQSRTLHSKSELQRFAALILLANVSNDEAAEAALRLIDDQQLNESLRLDAFQILIARSAQKGRLANGHCSVGKGKRRAEKNRPEISGQRAGVLRL